MDDYDALGAALARDVFAIVVRNDDKTQRIQFMGGTWPNEETHLGGLCEEALAQFLAGALRRRLPTGHSEKNDATTD